VDNNNYNSSNRRVDNNNISNKRVDNNNYKSKQIDVDRKQTAGAVINWIESGKSKERVFKSEAYINESNFRISECGLNRVRWTKTYKINGKNVTFKVDTGADVNCIPSDLVKELKLEVKKENILIFDYNNVKVNNFGKVKANCYDLNSETAKCIEFLVVDAKCEPLLGLKSSVELKLIKHLNIDSICRLPQTTEEFVEKCSQLFQGLG